MAVTLDEVRELKDIALNQRTVGPTKSQRCTTRTLERSQESRATLAQRGELFTTLPAGYEKVDCGLIEPSPDQRQRDAIGLVFAKFAELRSVRQLWLWFRREQVEIPVRLPGAGLVWKLPTDTGLRSMLGNPIYAGAYAFGRSRQETVIENGRKRVRRSGRITEPEEWAVLLKDRHKGYITWDEYERNQDLIAANNTKVRGAVREGRALLAEGAPGQGSSKSWSVSAPPHLAPAKRTTAEKARSSCPAARVALARRPGSPACRSRPGVRTRPQPSPD